MNKDTESTGDHFSFRENEMDAEERERLDDLARNVIGAVYGVAEELGAGFLEKVYERALVVELKDRGIKAVPQTSIPIRYKGEPVGDYFADILVEGSLIVELKCVDHLSNEHMAQCLNYLKATNLHLALLVNYQHPKVEWRKVFRNY